MKPLFAGGLVGGGNVAPLPLDASRSASGSVAGAFPSPRSLWYALPAAGADRGSRRSRGSGGEPKGPSLFGPLVQPGEFGDPRGGGGIQLPLPEEHIPFPRNPCDDPDLSLWEWIHLGCLPLTPIHLCDLPGLSPAQRIHFGCIEVRAHPLPDGITAGALICQPPWPVTPDSVEELVEGEGDTLIAWGLLHQGAECLLWLYVLDGSDAADLNSGVPRMMRFLVLAHDAAPVGSGSGGYGGLRVLYRFHGPRTFRYERDQGLPHIELEDISGAIQAEGAIPGGGGGTGGTAGTGGLFTESLTHVVDFRYELAFLAYGASSQVHGDLAWEVFHDIDTSAIPEGAIGHIRASGHASFDLAADAQVALVSPYNWAYRDCVTAVRDPVTNAILAVREFLAFEAIQQASPIAFAPALPWLDLPDAVALLVDITRIVDLALLEVLCPF